MKGKRKATAAHKQKRENPPNHHDYATRSKLGYSTSSQLLPCSSSVVVPNHGYATRSKQGRCPSSAHSNPWPRLLPCSSSTVPSNFGNAPRSKFGLDLVGCIQSRKGVKDAPFLSDDVIFNILLLLPARVLYAEMRLVCRHWCSMINSPDFIRSHLQSSSTGLLLQGPPPSNMAFYLDATTRVFTQVELPFPASVLGSCNGIVLVCDYTKMTQFHLMNLTTKAILLSLPPTPPKWSNSYPYVAALSFSPCGHYKVVYAYCNAKEKPACMIVYTAGVDKAWRESDPGSMARDKCVKWAFSRSPLCISGFIYWISNGSVGFALDVNTEKFNQFPFPAGISRLDTSFLRLETGLGIVIRTPIEKTFFKVKTWEVYELIDVDSGAWTKVFEVNVPDLCSKIEDICGAYTHRSSRIIWYGRNGELWIYYSEFTRSSRSPCICLICLNTRNGDISLIPFDKEQYFAEDYPHVSTLLRLKSD